MGARRYGLQTITLDGQRGCAFTRPTTAADVRHRVQLSEPIGDHAELRLVAAVALSRDAMGEVALIGFAVEQRRPEGRWHNIMADLDDDADAANCAIVETMFGASKDDDAWMVRYAREARDKAN